MKFGTKKEFMHDFVFCRNVFRSMITNMATVFSYNVMSTNLTCLYTIFLSEVTIQSSVKQTTSDRKH